MDGVAVVPRVEAQRVLALAQQLDYKEHSMYGTIEQLKSIQEAQNLAVSSEIEGIPFKVHA
jgi:regulator of RNase E activity RraA